MTTDSLERAAIHSWIVARFSALAKAQRMGRLENKKFELRIRFQGAHEAALRRLDGDARRRVLSVFDQEIADICNQYWTPKSYIFARMSARPIFDRTQQLLNGLSDDDVLPLRNDADRGEIKRWIASHTRDLRIAFMKGTLEQSKTDLKDAFLIEFMMHTAEAEDLAKRVFHEELEAYFQHEWTDKFELDLFQPPIRPETTRWYVWLTILLWIAGCLFCIYVTHPTEWSQ